MSAPPPVVSEPPSVKPSRFTRWHRRILGLCLVIFAFELGLVFACLAVESELGTELGAGAFPAAGSYLDEPLLSRSGQRFRADKYLRCIGRSDSSTKVSLRR